MLKLSLISLFFASLQLFCYLSAYLSAISPDHSFSQNSCYFCFQIIKLSLAEALHGMLAHMPANQVLAKDIQLEIVVQDSQLEIREVNQLQKVSTSL